MATTNKAGDSASDFLVADDVTAPSTWHLQVKRAGAPDHRLMGAAWAALHGGYRGKAYEGPHKAEALATLIALYKAEDMDTPKTAGETFQYMRDDGELWIGRMLSNGTYEAIEPVQFDSPDVGDVHINAPMGSPTGVPYLKKLVQRVRGHFSSNQYMSRDQFANHDMAARGHAGGTAKGQKAAAEPADWTPCQHCMDGGAPGPECSCPACQEGDPDGCMCQEAMAADQSVDGSKVAHEPGDGHITSATGESFRLYTQAPHAFMEAPDWIPLLPKPGTYKHPRYGEIDMSVERNANFVRNFKAGVYQQRVPIDAEHETKVSGALGWIKDARQNADGTVDGHVDWTDRGRSMLAGDRFRYVSPEYYDRWRAPDTGVEHNDVLIGAAVCTRPFYKEGSLRPLVASEAGIQIPDEDSAPVPRSVQARPDAPPHMPQGDYQMAEDTTPQPVQLSEEQYRQFQEAMAENAALKQATEAAQNEAKVASERIAALETENRRRQFTETAQSWGGSQDAITAHVSFMESLPTDELRQQYVAQQQTQAAALAEAQKQAHIFRVVGVNSFDENSAEGKIEAAAKSIQTAEPGLTYQQAYAKALERNPQLYSEFESERATG